MAIALSGVLDPPLSQPQRSAPPFGARLSAIPADGPAGSLPARGSRGSDWFGWAVPGPPCHRLHPTCPALQPSQEDTGFPSCW